MADWINAVLGAALGAPAGSGLNLLMEQVKFVMHCKEECSSLVEYLMSIKPMLEEVSKQCQANPTLKEWLRGFEKCVQEGSDLIAKCRSDEKWVHWEEVRYGEQILKVKERLERILKVAPIALISLRNPSSSTSKLVQEVPRAILGMEHHFKVVHGLVLEGFERDTNTCVSIRGMGGAGKTLLAQMVNNDKEIEAKFGKDSIFWITVGREAWISSIYEHMRKYLNVPYNGESLTDQRTILKEAFSKRRVLLILDDVWDHVYVEHESMIKWLNIASGHGSVTVVTTRMESVTRLMKAREEVILLLSEEDSWRLFCIHAFDLEIPILDGERETLAKDVCKECNRLPLALKVIGCAMNGESDVVVWKSTLKRMQVSGKVNKSVEEELFKRLQISYDQLDEALKICFLYFAAFPEDYKVPTELLCQIWIAEGLFDGNNRDEEEVLYEATLALNELRKRCLIELSSSWGVNYVQMHDLLRDLAVQLTSKGEESTRESLFMFAKGNYEAFETSRLGLQTLKVKRMSLRGYKRMIGKLNAPYVRVCLLNFKTAEFGASGIGNNSHCTFVDTNFFEDKKDLRYFQIQGYSFLETLPESIGGLGSLRHFNLQYCQALKELPKSIGGLGSLRHLYLEYCWALKELPKSIGGLKSLQHLTFKACALEELPESIGELRSLQHLNLRICTALKELPKSIGGLVSLQKLNLDECEALKLLPESIGGLGSLRHLSLRRCIVLMELPESIRGLMSLQYFNLGECYALKELPEWIGGMGSLQDLNLGCCIAIKELPESIGRLRSLQYLYLDSCVAMMELPKSIGGLTSLQYLHLNSCVAMMGLPKSIGGLTSLKSLDLSMCNALKELPESIGGLGSLQYLNLERCNALKELPESIGRLGSLQHFTLKECEALKELPKSIGGLMSLEFLDLSMCNALKELPESIGGLMSLKFLNLNMCNALKELPESIGGLGSLQCLILEGCEAIKELPESIGRLGSLQYLLLKECKALKELPKSIGGLMSLEFLDLGMCNALKELPESIGGLGSLQYLNLKRCFALKELPESIGGLPCLQKLNLKVCGVVNLLTFSKVFQLRILF